MAEDPVSVLAGIPADLSDMAQEGEALGVVLRDLESRADSFGAAMTGALTRAAASGRGLDEILKTTASRLIDIALSAGLAPLQTTVQGGISAGFEGLARSIGAGGSGAGGSGAGGSGAGGSGAGGIGTPSFLAGRLPAPGSVAGGSVAPGAGVTSVAAPTVVFNVTAPDVDSFRRSEGQIAAMLTRTVGRGRRGV